MPPSDCTVTVPVALTRIPAGDLDRAASYALPDQPAVRAGTRTAPLTHIPAWLTAAEPSAVPYVPNGRRRRSGFLEATAQQSARVLRQVVVADETAARPAGAAALAIPPCTAPDDRARAATAADVDRTLTLLRRLRRRCRQPGKCTAIVLNPRFTRCFDL